MLNVEEVAKLFDPAPGIRWRAALGVTYGDGLRVSDVAHAETGRSFTL